tara:strand:+ start:327 stop:497 length:171 start_codon:yes stop_codon:yes gene_type:complete
VRLVRASPTTLIADAGVPELIAFSREMMDAEDNVDQANVDQPIASVSHPSTFPDPG